MIKCKGCGILLQDKEEKQEGYTKKLEKKLCERCFRIKNYNEYKIIEKDNTTFKQIIKNINKKDLVILTADLFNIDEINKLEIENDILLVITKIDLLPKSFNPNKILNSIKLKVKDKIIVSAVKNYNLDELYNKINKYKTSNTVYVVGYTNAGKSTLINKLIYNYSDNNSEITTSNLPSTTLDEIQIKVNENLTLIDTPGILDEGNIIHTLNEKQIKKITITKHIKPLVLQIKTNQTVCIDDICKLELNDNNLIFYISNNLNIKRYYKKTENLNLSKRTLQVEENSDLVIKGLGFINIKKKGTIDIYIKDDIDVYVRKSFLI